MVFLDHLKPLYTVDLKLLESEGLVGLVGTLHAFWMLTPAKNTIIVADNVVKPGNPAYLSWVRATPEQKQQSLQQPPLTSQPPATPNPADDAWSTAFYEGPLEETRWGFPEAEGITADGDPYLVYESRMLDGWDPYTGERDACEVSTCVGRVSRA